MEFDKFMDRYDNLVRRNALLEADVKTWQDRYATLQSEVIALRAANHEYERLDWYKAAQEVCQEFPSKGKIDLIKELRDRTGCGLKDAKDMIERIQIESKQTLGELLRSKMR